MTIALLSLTVVPFLYLCLRYYTSTLVNREERVKELESKLIERLYETFGAMRLVKSFAREPHELRALREARASTTMNARIAITWQQSLFSVVVSTITILGTALVVIVGGRFVMRGTLSDRRAATSSSPTSAPSTGRCRRSRTRPASCRARSPAPSACARCSR